MAGVNLKQAFVFGIENKSITFDSFCIYSIVVCGNLSCAFFVTACHVLKCPDGLAQDVINTVGQAFELRFKQYLKNPPKAVTPPDRTEPLFHDGKSR